MAIPINREHDFRCVTGRRDGFFASSLHEPPQNVSLNTAIVGDNVVGMVRLMQRCDHPRNIARLFDQRLGLPFTHK